MWITLGLKLLGWGKALKEFIFTHWKVILPIVLVLAALLWTKEHYYSAGQSDERASWELKIKKETDKNAKISADLSTALANIGVLVAQKETLRLQKEVTHEQKIQTIIRDNPVYKQCVIDQAVLDEQNAIKALGPKQ